MVLVLYMDEWVAAILKSRIAIKELLQKDHKVVDPYTVTVFDLHTVSAVINVI